MRVWFAVGLVVASLTASTSAWAQATAAPKGDAIDFLEKNTLQLRLGLFSGTKVIRAGKDLELGAFGGNAKKIFAGVPSALDSMSTFRTIRITGVVVYAIGLAAMLVDLGLLITKNEAVYSGFSGFTTLGLGILVGGGVVGLSGAIMMGAAVPHLTDAIGKYNAAMFERARGMKSAAGLAVPRRFQASLKFAF